MSVAYKDYANDKLEDSARLSSSEITSWFHANIATESAGLAAGGIKGLNSFPGRLYRILSSPEHTEVICWMEHGRAWKMLQPKVFVEVVLPKYSATTKYPNFLRQVNAWGFRRILSGRDKGCYFHEMFLRSKPHLVGRMKKPKGKPEALTEFPNFYSMPYLPQEGSGAAAKPISPMYAPECSSGSAGTGGASSDDESNVCGTSAKPSLAPAAIAQQAAAAQGKLQGAKMTDLVQQFQQQVQAEQCQSQQLQQQRMQCLPGQVGQNGQQTNLHMTINIDANVNFSLNNEQMKLQNGNVPPSPTTSGSCTGLESGMIGAPLQQQQQNMQILPLQQGSVPQVTTVSESEPDSEASLSESPAPALPTRDTAVSGAGMLQTVWEAEGQGNAGDDLLLGPSVCGSADLEKVGKEVKELEDDLVIDNLLRQAEAETSDARIDISAAAVARAGSKMSGRRRSSAGTEQSGDSFEQAFGKDEDILAVMGQASQNQQQEAAPAPTTRAGSKMRGRRRSSAGTEQSGDSFEQAFGKDEDVFAVMGEEMQKQQQGTVPAPATGQQVQQQLLQQMTGVSAQMAVNTRATVLCVGQMPPLQEAVGSQQQQQQQQQQIGPNLQMGMPAGWFAQLEPTPLRPLYEWSQTLDVETHIRLECYMPVAFPIMSWLLGHSALGFTICFAIYVIHTIEVLVTDFGPRTASYCWRSWIGPNGHRIMDVSMFGGLTFMMFVMPDEFGPFATESAIVLFFVVIEFIVVSYNAQLYIGESTSTKKRRDARQKAMVEAKGTCGDVGLPQKDDKDLKVD